MSAFGVGGGICSGLKSRAFPTKLGNSIGAHFNRSLCSMPHQDHGGTILYIKTFQFRAPEAEV